uniref:Uncharacterized protein n=1 Tax=Leersia perrieri TaxID=77586 RepID=A0A0D9VNE7_9ORYZ
MAASPEFYRPTAPPSPVSATGAMDEEQYSSCRTPTHVGIKEPTTCPPAPRKPRPVACRKLHLDPSPHHQIISLRLDDLHRLFRPT